MRRTIYGLTGLFLAANVGQIKTLHLDSLGGDVDDHLYLGFPSHLMNREIVAVQIVTTLRGVLESHVNGQTVTFGQFGKQ